MNRKIKFRGKLTYDNCWVYGYLVYSEKDKEYCILRSDDIKIDGHHIRQTSDRPVFTYTNTIGQFTRLYDRKNKAIYENDILQITINGVKFLYIVKWNTEVGAWCLMLKGDAKEGVRPLGVWLSDRECEIEVVGNIYDNKELLED